MRFRRTSFCIVVTTLAVAGWVTSSAFSQGSGSSRTEQPQSGRIIERPRTARPQTQEEFLDTFWRFIVKKDVAYNSWNVWKREKAEDGNDNPHGDFSKTYANKVAADNPTGLPNGSILVREDYDADQKRVSISVMYRVNDYDKEHGNWYWMKFMESGTSARTSKEDGNKLVAGKVTSCVECHANATGKDYVFSNPLPSDAAGKDQQ